MYQEYFEKLNEIDDITGEVKEHLLEMSEIGRLDKYKIQVFSNEGPIPHFHFYHPATQLKGCIKINEPEYFFHGKYTDVLPENVVQELNAWLNKPYKRFPQITNYEQIRLAWSENNVDYEIPLEFTKPDYSKLK